MKMMKLVNECTEALEKAQECGIGDESLNKFFLEVFSRLGDIRDSVKELQKEADALDDLVRDRYEQESYKRWKKNN